MSGPSGSRHRATEAKVSFFQILENRIEKKENIVPSCRYLPDLTSGSMMGALCVAEEGAGSDPASVESTALKSEDGDFYILNGTKTWVVGGADAGLFTVFAKLKMKNYLGEDDLLNTAFLVERGFGGIEVSEPRRLAGLKGLDLVDVTFKDVKVPINNVLGVEGQGLQVNLTLLRAQTLFPS